MAEAVNVQLVGGPTAVIEYGGLRFLTDPTFDPPGEYTSRPGVALVKRSGPAVPADAVGAIDAVLLSHDHHFDNLDREGRAVVAAAPLALTTPSGAARLGAPARALAPWEAWELARPEGQPVTVTAVPALHGPPGTEHIIGEVTGFYLSSPGLPTVYVSGDNASVAVVREIVARLGSAPISILHTGAARVADIGPEPLTLSADRAAAVAVILGARRVIPVHFEGWAHFSQGAAAVQDAFAAAGLDALLSVPAPGETVSVAWPASLRIAAVGGDGIVGNALVREALARGHRADLHAGDDDLAGVLAGLDVAVASVAGRQPDEIPAFARRLLAATDAAGVPRLLWIGGAGTLEVIPGLRALDSPSFPAADRPEALAEAEALAMFRDSRVGVEWSCLSPPASVEADGLGGEAVLVAQTDALLRDPFGESRIALRDLVRTALDELEAPRFARTRFTVAALPLGARVGARVS